MVAMGTCTLQFDSIQRIQRKNLYLRFHKFTLYLYKKLAWRGWCMARTALTKKNGMHDKCIHHK